MKDLSFLKQSLIAHRGLHDNINVPENSIKAFELAIKYKNIIELDVHLLKDDTLVVFHDFNLKRMTGISEKIEKYSYDELKKVKLLDTNYIIPTLKDVLNIVNGKVPILLEVKSDNKSTKINKEIVKLMDNYNGKYAIQSFNPYVVLWFKRNKKDYITGLLMGNKAKTFSESLIRSKIIFKICNPDFISAYYKKDIKKYKKFSLAWTIKNKDILEKYKEAFDNFICENMEGNLWKKVN